MLALGLLDGGIVILDIALGMEKYFLEKHPAAVSSVDFYDDKILISGSIDGRVNLCDLDSENQERVYNCQNIQDQKIPIVKVMASDFGMGVAVDIEGNCRFYDLVRLRKLAKINAKTNMNGGFWRMLPQPVMCTTSESFFGVTCSDEQEAVKVPEPPQPPPVDPKNP